MKYLPICDNFNKIYPLVLISVFNMFLQLRYRDIAPRNYGAEEVSPPRYTSNPSLPGPAPGAGGEYERPPPYYYPGPPE